MAIVRATIELAHALGLRVIAEGVEDAATFNVLRGMGLRSRASFTFTRAGRYPYVRMQHEGDGMAAEVTVVN